MEGLGVAASVIAVVQLAAECLMLSRRWLGPTEFGSSERSALVTKLYEFTGVMKTFQTHLEIYEDDAARLVTLDYLNPALERCSEALTLVRDFMQNAGVLGMYVLGPRFDDKAKSAIMVLEGARELFMIAVHADQHTILLAVETYIRNAAEDIRDIRAALEENGRRLDDLAEGQANQIRGSEAWRSGATARLDDILDVTQSSRNEAADERRRNQEWQEASSRTTALINTSVSRQEAENDRMERQKILDWLTPIDFARQQSDLISRRQAGTGQWFLSSTEYQTWLAEKRRILFCPGIPGGGKTILTAISVEYLEERYKSDPNVGIAYIYFNYRTQHEQNRKDLLKNLIKQFSQRRVQLPEKVRELYNRFENTRYDVTCQDLSSTLENVIRLYSQVYILLDALDEFQIAQGGRSEFLCEIIRLQSCTNMNLFATSRPIVDIEAEFQDPIVLEIVANNEDICIYIDANISQLLPFVSRKPELQYEIKIAITKAVEGMFLLAQLYLASLEDKTTVKAIKFAISQFQKTNNRSNRGDKAMILGEAYKNAMERIEGQRPGLRQLAMKVLQWICRANRPLDKAELQHAIAVEIGETEFDEDNISQVVDLVSVCAGLVTLDNESDVIRLVHYTTQEYFEKTHEHWFPNSDEEIVGVCATYLSYEAFGTGRSERHQDYLTRLQHYPLYKYAVCNWAHHSRLSSYLSEYVISFLKKAQNVDAAAHCLFTETPRSQNSRDIRRRNPEQVTGLHLAAYFRLRKEMAQLVEDAPELDVVDSSGQTVLSWASESGYEYGSALLLETMEVTVDSKDNAGRTPLIYAAMNGHTAITSLLINTGNAQIDIRDNDGRTALLWASLDKQWDTARFLLESGADAAIGDKNGQTPLSIAAEGGFESMVTALLSVDGLDADTKDTCGLSPLILAAAFEHHEITTMLASRLGRQPRQQSLGITAVKRVIRGVRAQNHDPAPHLFPIQMVADDLTHWQTTILGPDGSPYENGLFTLDYRFPVAYPFQPPAIKFITRIFHPNITPSGVINITLFGIEWSPINSVSSTLLSILLVLGSPLLDDETQGEIPDMYRNHPEQFERTAREWTVRYAM